MRVDGNGGGTNKNTSICLKWAILRIVSMVELYRVVKGVKSNFIFPEFVNLGIGGGPLNMMKLTCSSSLDSEKSLQKLQGNWKMEARLQRKLPFYHLGNVSTLMFRVTVGWYLCPILSNTLQLIQLNILIKKKKPAWLLCTIHYTVI